MFRDSPSRSRMFLAIGLGLILLVLLGAMVMAQPIGGAQPEMSEVIVPAIDTPMPESTDTPPSPTATETPTEAPQAPETTEPGPDSGEAQPEWFEENRTLLLVFGALFVLAALAAGVLFFLRGRRSRRQSNASGGSPPSPKVGPDGTVVLPAPTPEGEQMPTIEGARLVSLIEPGFALRLQPGRNLIGRSPQCSVKITNRLPHWETVSREHAEIIFEQGRYILRDLNSVNGVYVQGRRSHENILRDGWTIGIGGVEFRFEDGSSQDSLQAMGRSSS